jgi:hypothetical protein
MSVVHLTQRLSSVLTISNILGSRGIMLLLCPFVRVLLASCFLFLDRVLLPWVASFDGHVVDPVFCHQKSKGG